MREKLAVCLIARPQAKAQTADPPFYGCGPSGNRWTGRSTEVWPHRAQSSMRILLPSLKPI